MSAEIFLWRERCRERGVVSIGRPRLLRVACVGSGRRGTTGGAWREARASTEAAVAASVWRAGAGGGGVLIVRRFAIAPVRRPRLRHTDVVQVAMDRAPQDARNATAFRELVELGRPGDVEPGWVPGPDLSKPATIEDAVAVMKAQRFNKSCRVLLVSPEADGTSNADNVTMDAVTDSTVPCTCPKPTLGQVLSGNFDVDARPGLKFVVEHGVGVARKLYAERPDWFCGVKVLRNSTGYFHAAWIGPFYEDNSPGGHECIVRSELGARGLDAHARIFRAANFPEDREAWDYVVEFQCDVRAGGSAPRASGGAGSDGSPAAAAAAATATRAATARSGTYVERGFAGSALGGGSAPSHTGQIRRRDSPRASAGNKKARVQVDSTEDGAEHVGADQASEGDGQSTGATVTPGEGGRGAEPVRAVSLLTGTAPERGAACDAGSDGRPPEHRNPFVRTLKRVAGRIGESLLDMSK